MRSLSVDDPSEDPSSFHELVDEWVSGAWKSGERNFAGLLGGLPGVYPPEVLASLDRLARSKRIPLSGVTSIRREISHLPRLRNLEIPIVSTPLEHPLDFEWRFTQAAVGRILRTIREKHAQRGLRVLCLGCPSVYWIGRREIPEFTFELWDKNGHLLDQLEEAQQLRSVDLTCVKSARTRADVVVLDPPWYVSFYQLFLAVAAASIPVGGRIFLSFPPTGTRPSAESDFGLIRRWSAKHGLTLELVERSYLPYRSPLFEVNALKAEGMVNCPLNWRRGNLVVFKKVRNEQVSLLPQPTPDAWDEVRIGSVRVKISSSRKPALHVLKAVGEEEVLPSVSSRHPLRENANVVTSGNRFLETSAPAELLGGLRSLLGKDGGQLSSVARAPTTPLLLRRAIKIICKEQKEAALYLKRIHEVR